MAISDWPVAERPRERLMAAGPGALSDAELLAVILRTGIRGRSAVDLGRELLQRSGGWRGLLAAKPRQLGVKGLGTAKSAQLLALLEIARRSLGEQLRDAPALASPAAVRDYLRLTLGGRDREVFLVLFLDAQHRTIGSAELFCGSLTQASVHPREVVRAALGANAAAVILAHNHPSGIAQPSAADELLTRQLREALALVEIRVLDHFIVAGNQCLSFAERGLL